MRRKSRTPRPCFRLAVYREKFPRASVEFDGPRCRTAFHGPGGPGQGIHPGGRYFSGGPVRPSSKAEDRCGAHRSLPASAGQQSVALHVFSQFRRLADRRVLARNPGQGRRRGGRSPSGLSPGPGDVRPTRRRIGPWKRNCIDSEKECAEHVMLVDLARNDAGRVSQYGTVKVEPVHDRGALQPRHAPGLPGSGGGFARGRTRWTPSWPVSRPGPCLGRPQGPGHGDHRRTGASGPGGLTAGRWAISVPNGEMDTCIAIRMIVFQGRKSQRPGGRRHRGRLGPGHGISRKFKHKAAQSIAALKRAAEGGI